MAHVVGAGNFLHEAIAVFPVDHRVNITVIVPTTLTICHSDTGSGDKGGDARPLNLARRSPPVKTLLSLGALALAIAGTTISAKADCVGRESLHCLVSTAIDPPKQRHEKADDAAPLNHPVVKRAKPQRGDDEKAPAVKPPPALPPQVTQK
jgi:hypothetical protein